ncbi:MAG: PLP-dependent aminotransferase family protein [Candidatus Latescibacterota bacterium]
MSVSTPYLSLNLNVGPAARGPTSALLVERIQQQLGRDQAPPGARMPPVRVLAHHLGLSNGTVQRAYDELVARGLLESRRRVGVFVATQPRAPGRVAAAPAAAAPPFIAAPPPGPRAPRRSTARQPILLSGATIDPDLLPTEKFAACLRSVARERRTLAGTYPDVQGFLPLRQKIAQRLTRRGIPAQPEQVVTALGSQQCLDLVCRALTNKRIAVENPAYQIGKSLFEINGVELIGLPLDPFNGIDLDDWEQRIARARPGLLYLIPSFQNPTGYTYSTRELNQVVEWSAAYGCGILEDDWGSEMLSFSEFRPSLRARGGDGVLYMNAFTKKLLPSLRLGYLVGDERTVPALLRSKHVATLGTPLIIEAAVFEFLDRGYYDVHLRQLHAELDDRYQRCLDVLRSQMPEGVRWTTPGGGPLLWLEVPARVSLTRVAARLAERGVHVLPSDPAFFGSPHLHGFRICYSAIKPEPLQQGLELLAEAIRRESST